MATAEYKPGVVIVGEVVFTITKFDGVLRVGARWHGPLKSDEPNIIPEEQQRIKEIITDLRDYGIKKYSPFTRMNEYFEEL